MDQQQSMKTHHPIWGSFEHLEIVVRLILKAKQSYKGILIP